MYVILPDGDTDIVIIHVIVNISSEFLVIDRFAVAIGILYPALAVINSSLVAVYELAVVSLTVNDNITELFSVEIAGGLRKDSVTFVPDDVVITIPIDGAFTPR